MDVRWFPFDIQRCELKFGSWTFDGWLLDIQMKEADVSGYMTNGEWDLLGETGSRDSGWQTVLLSNSAYIRAMQCCNPPVCTKDKLHLNICLWSESSSGSMPHDVTLKLLNDKSEAVCNMFCSMWYKIKAVSVCFFSLRGPWRSSWSFLWLLCRALPWCYLCGDFTEEDLVLCSQSPDSMCAPLFYDAAGLLAACQLRGKDQLGWGVPLLLDKN